MNAPELQSGSNENTSIYAFNGLLPSRSTFAFTGGGGGDDDGDEPLGENKRLKLVQVPLPGQAEGHPKFNNLDEIYQKKITNSLNSNEKNTLKEK